MNIRTKTVRRLLLLGVVLAVVGAGVAGGVYYLRQQREARIAQARADGLEAYRQGNYPKALEGLRIYHGQGRVSNDAETLAAQADAAMKTESPDGSHFREAMGAMTYYLRVRPDDLEMRGKMMDLQLRTGLIQEAQRLAEETLQRDGRDVRALRTRAISLHLLKQWEASLKAAEAWAAVEPLALEPHLLVLAQMTAVKRTPEQLVAYAQKLLEAHPNDGRFELLMAHARGMAGDNTGAMTMLRQAAGRDIDDLDYIKDIAHRLELAGRFAEALAYLQRAAARLEDADLRTQINQRMWQNGEVDKLLKEIDGKPLAKVDTSLLGYGVMLLHRQNRTADYAQLLGELERRRDDQRARAWHVLLAARTAADMTPRNLIAACQRASVYDPENPVIHWMHGEALMMVGERELALQPLRVAADRAPSWADPRIKIAVLLGQLGRHDEAVKEAAAAWQRAPDSGAAMIMYVVANYNHLSRSPTATRNDLERLLEVCNQVQRLAPLESNTLPVQVALNARLGKKDVARAIVNGALADDAPLSSELVLKLMSVSEQESLGLEEPLRAYAGRVHGGDPLVVVKQAFALNDQGLRKEALELLTRGAEANPNNALRWRVAMAMFKDRIAPDEALALWRELGEANAGSVELQKVILGSSAALRDRAFYQRTFERVRDLTGADGRDWRLAQARWLLEAGGADGQRSWSEAVNKLSDLVREAPQQVEARIYLAQGFRKLGMMPNAIEQLRLARGLGGEQPELALQLAALLQESGRYPESREVLTALAGQRTLQREQREAAAAMMLKQGMNAEAARLVQQGQDQASVTQAEALRRAGRVADAEKVYETLLAARPVSAVAIRSAVNFFAIRGDLPRARQTLDLLSVSDAAPGDAELLRGAFEAALGNHDEALRLLGEGTSKAPANLPAWRELVRLQLELRRVDDAAAAADRALAANPGNADLQMLKHVVRLVRAAPGTPEMAAVLGEMQRDTDHAAIADTLRLQERYTSGDVSDERMLVELRELLRKHPQYKQLHVMLIQQHLRYRPQPTRAEVDEVIAATARMLEVFPADLSVARYVIAVQRSVGRWDQVLLSARKLRELMLDRPREADLWQAEALVRLRQADAAKKVLEPYLKQARDSQSLTPGLAMRLAEILCASGASGEVADLFRERLDEPVWRAMLAQAAGSIAPDLATGKAWLDMLRAHVPADQPGELFGEARAWQVMALRLNSREAHARAVQLFAALAEKTQSAQVLVGLAQSAEMSGDLAAAEGAYRKALAHEATRDVAANNLAMVLVRRGEPGKLADALAMVDEAIKRSPQQVHLHDTRGRVLLAMGRPGDAVGAFQTARTNAMNDARLLLEPMIGLADALMRDGKQDRALAVLGEIDSLLRAAPAGALSAELQAQLQSVRQALQRSSTAGSQ